MVRKKVEREIPEPTHTDRPFFYGMAREDKKQPMTEVIAHALAGYQARYGVNTRPTQLVCHPDLAQELGKEYEGMQVWAVGYINPGVVYVGANPPA